MEIETVGVIGAGQMGAGIAQVCASIGKVVTLCDIKQDLVDSGINSISKNLQRSVSKDRVSRKQMDETLANISTSLENKDLSNCDIIIEAIIEDVDIKKNLFSSLGDICEINFGDKKLFVNYVLKLYKNRKLLNKLGKNAKKNYIKTHNTKKNLNKLDQIYSNY